MAKQLSARLALPLVLVVDQHGVIRHVHEKYRDGDAGTYEAELRALFRESGPGPVARLDSGSRAPTLNTEP